MNDKPHLDRLEQAWREGKAMHLDNLDLPKCVKCGYFRTPDGQACGCTVGAKSETPANNLVPPGNPSVYAPIIVHTAKTLTGKRHEITSAPQQMRMHTDYLSNPLVQITGTLDVIADNGTVRYLIDRVNRLGTMYCTKLWDTRKPNEM